MELKGLNAVITGAAAGLGQVVALTLAQHGANLLIADKQSGDHTLGQIQEMGGTARFIPCDVRKEDDVVALGKTAGEYFGGKIDILVNNAAHNGYYHLLQDMPLHEWEDTLRVNLTGVMLVTREITPYMIQMGTGRIVNVASNVARRGLPYRGDYVCSKWALLGLTQTLALELAPHNIRVNAVCPGPIEGDRIEQVMDMHAKVENRTPAEVRTEWENSAPMMRFVKPDEVASIIVFLLSDSSSCMTGQALNATGGFLMT